MNCALQTLCVAPLVEADGAAPTAAIARSATASGIDEV